MAEKTYRDLQQELDSLLAELRRDDLDVDAAIQTYQKAAAVIKTMQAQLKKAEHTIRDVTK